MIVLLPFAVLLLCIAALSIASGLAVAIAITLANLGFYLTRGFALEVGCRRRTAAVGGVEIDDVAKQNLVVFQRVTPADDGLHGQRTLADPADHPFAAGLDSFGDFDLALPRQQLDRTHFEEVHANRIVGAPELVIRCVRGNSSGVGGRDRLALGDFLALLVFDDVDAHLRQQRHGVLDLIRRHLVRRQHFVKIIVRDIAAFFGALQETLDAGLRRIYEQAVLLFLADLPGFFNVRGLGHPYAHPLGSASTECRIVLSSLNDHGRYNLDSLRRCVVTKLQEAQCRIFLLRHWQKGALSSVIGHLLQAPMVSDGRKRQTVFRGYPGRFTARSCGEQAHVFAASSDARIRRCPDRCPPPYNRHSQVWPSESESGHL